MLDIVLFRVDQGGNPDLVRESQRRRFKDVGAVDRVIDLDTKWRAARHKADLLNRMGNVISKTVGEKKKAEAAATRQAGHTPQVASSAESQIKVANQQQRQNQLRQLEQHLTHNSYLNGHWPGALDAQALLSLECQGGLPSTAQDQPALRRWWQHMLSYSDAERSALPCNTQPAPLLGLEWLAKEAEGTETSIPIEVKEALLDLTPELLRPLSVSQLKEVKKLIEITVAENNASLTQTETERDAIIKEIGNLVHDSVVVSQDEANNGIVRTVGEKLSKKYSHVDLIHMIGGMDAKRGTVTAGGRGYYLMGPAVSMERAIVDLSLELLRAKGFTPIVTPFFVRREVMQEVAQLSQFDEELYKVTGKSESGEGGDDDKYLIATSEQPLAAFHRDEWIAKDMLPLRYAGISYCFRQEVGSHGRDTRGIFRVHQFQKVEQFVLTSPHDNASWIALDEMMANAESLCQALGLSYQVVNIVSGELNNAAAKKLDLEAYFPASGAYRELVSCSNCTDYQSRRLRVRFGATKAMNAAVDFVHMLNATMCATTRVICAVLETHQTDDGVTVPEALRKFMPAEYREFIPFTQPAPIDEEEAKKQKKKKAGKKDS